MLRSGIKERYAFENSRFPKKKKGKKNQPISRKTKNKTAEIFKEEEGVRIVEGGEDCLLVCFLFVYLSNHDEPSTKLDRSNTPVKFSFFYLLY